jgi:hypothetical protein
MSKRPKCRRSIVKGCPSIAALSASYAADFYPNAEYLPLTRQNALPKTLNENLRYLEINIKVSIHPGQCWTPVAGQSWKPVDRLRGEVHPAAVSYLESI